MVTKIESHEAAPGTPWGLEELFGFWDFKFWILNFKIWTIKKIQKTKNPSAIFDNSISQPTTLDTPSVQKRNAKWL